MKLTLASKSPRRLALLRAIGIDVSVSPVDCDERRLDGEAPRAMVERLAIEKSRLLETAPEVLVVAADTVVALGNVVFGKPADEQAAVDTLRTLSGKTHEVLTGYCVRAGAHIQSGVVDTQVTFRNLTEEEISAYVATGECFDKSGAYGIQGDGGALTLRIHGSYTNVVGLPMDEVLTGIKRIRRFVS